MIYFDANYLVRLYFDDRGFEVVRDLASQQSVVCSVYGRAEVVAAFHRKWREGAIAQPFYATTLQQFADECRAEAYRWIPLSPAILQRVEKYFATLPQSLFLRAGDAIHLATAAENGFKEIYSNDKRLLAAANHFDVKGVNVI